MNIKLNLESEHLKYALEKLSIYDISIHCEGYERVFKRGTKEISIDVELKGNIVNASHYPYNSNVEIKHNKSIEYAIGEALIDLDYKMSAGY